MENLADFLVQCVIHDKARNQSFLISDGEDVSTAELAHLIAAAMGRSSRLLPLPEQALRAVAKMLGREKQVNRLLGSLVVSSEKARTLLEWAPPLTLNEGIEGTVRWYLSECRER